MRPESITVTALDRARLERWRSDPLLGAELERADVVSSERTLQNVVTMNSQVLFEDESSGERRQVTVVYPDDADAARGKVSVLAPVGTALLGLSVGQCIDWPFPNGTTRRLRVLQVFHQADPEQGRWADRGFLPGVF